jgi:hypothetical protein
MSSSPSEQCQPNPSVPITENEEPVVQQEDDSAYVLCQCDSSENEEEKAVKTEHRSWIMMWTFPTPRSYLKTYEERKKANEFIPRDITREEIQTKFLDVLTKCHLMNKLKQMIVVYEPHKKLQPDSLEHEMHYHVCFKMSANFAHLGVANALAHHHGLQGHMSYPRKGWLGMAKYVLQESAVKLTVHLDPTPLFWPARMTKEQMLKKMQLNEEDYMKKMAEENKLQAHEEKNTGAPEYMQRYKKKEESSISQSSPTISYTTKLQMSKNFGCWPVRREMQAIQYFGTMLAMPMWPNKYRNVTRDIWHSSVTTSFKVHPKVLANIHYLLSTFQRRFVFG